MKLVRAAAWIAVLGMWSSVVSAGAPASRPDFRIDHLPPARDWEGLPDAFINFQNSGSFYNVSPELRFTFVDLIDDATRLNLDVRLNRLPARQDKLWYFYHTELDGGQEVRVSLAVPTRLGPEPAPDVRPAAKELAAALARELNVDPSLSADARRAAIEQKQAELNEVIAARDVLATVLTSKVSKAQQPLSERLSAWQNTMNELQEQMRTKGFRLQALERHRDRLLAEREKAQSADPVIVELKKIVDLRKQKLQRVEATVGAGGSADSELLNAKEAAAEAELRLAERSTAVVPSGTVASLDQIGQEIVKISIDLDELRSKYIDVKTNLDQYQVGKATTQSLAKMARRADATEDDAKAWKQWDDLKRQTRELKDEILRLKIVKVEAAY